jgi:hypothetical protein
MKIAGNPGLVFQGYRIARDTQGGRQMFAVWSGPAAAVTAAAGQLDKSNTPYNVDGIGPRWTLEQRITSDGKAGETEATSREERLHYARTSQSLWVHPALSNVDSATRLRIKKAAEGDETVILENLGLLAAELAIAELIVKQVDGFPVDRPTVIVTLTALFNHAWPVSFQNAGRIFTKTQMIADAELISSWAANLPQDTPDPDGKKYGWRKSPPEIVTVAGDRSQLIVEYEYDLWDLLLNPAAT